MARRLDSFDFGKRTGKPKYPWDKWANGEPWEVVQGRDYTCTSGSFLVYLYHKAREMGGVGCTGVQTSRERGTGRRRDRVRFQFLYANRDDTVGEPVRRKLKRKQR